MDHSTIKEIDRAAATGESESLPPVAGERRERIEIKPLKVPIEVTPAIPGMVGTSARMRQLAEEIIRKAKYEYDVLIEGETGTGKTLAATTLHWASKRAGKPLVRVNSSLFTQEMIESKLFGHERGSFTGATERRIGLLEAAHGGILFFDEIGEMPLALQAKVLTALEDKQFYRLGGRELIKCDVRIIYATNRDLEKMIQQGTFREDLYYRIRTLRIRVPNLDERREDIPLLVNAALEEFARVHDCEQVISVEERAMTMLMERAWPGNVRELQHAIIDLAVALDGRLEITGEDVDAVLGANVGVLSVGERDSDAKTIIVPPYLIGEDYKHYLDRILIFIYNTLVNVTNSPKRASEIMKSDIRTLNQRLKRAYQRLESAAATARLLLNTVQAISRVKRSKVSMNGKDEFEM